MVFGGPKLLDGDSGSELVERYRAQFVPSRYASEPLVILNIHALVADSDADALDMARSEAWAYVNAQTQGAFLPLESPAAINARELTERQQARMQQMLTGTIAGTVDRVATTIEQLVRRTGAAEVLLSGSAHDPAALLHSDYLLAKAFGL